MMSTPPEIPPALPLKNPFQQLALASWLAPVLGVALNILMIMAQVPAGSIVHLLAGLFCLAGFVCGIIAFFGIPKYGAKGILGHAIAGVSITGLMIFLGAISFVNARDMMQQRRQENLSSVAREGANSFLDYPGWFGRALISGGVVAIVSINELSPASQEFNSHFSRKLSIVSLEINNLAGSNALVLDPFSLKLINADGSSQNCETADNVFASVAVDRPEFIAHFGGPASVPPGRQSTAHWGFFATGTDYSKAVAMAALINGQEVTISGQYLTPEQKKQIFQPGKQTQK